MKTILSTFLVFTAVSSLWSQTCDPVNGNVVIYTNYDGGVLNINCDEDIPDLKIGVCTYEDCQVNITGPFAGNVTQVVYAGFQGDNDNCNSGVTTTTITGVPAGITSVFFAPAGVLSDPNGNANIICAYSCNPGGQGGCNTAAQVVAYFLNQFGGTLHTYYTQYACWNGATINVSDDLCCSELLPSIDATITLSDDIVCVGQCIDYFASSSGNPTSYEWSFSGAATTDSNEENPTGICYLTPGVYSTTLTVADGNGSGSATSSVTVIPCGILGCTYPDALNYNPAATVDDLSCEFECDEVGVSCLGDFNLDGIVNATDLLMFLGNYGEVCG